MRKSKYFGSSPRSVITLEGALRSLVDIGNGPEVFRRENAVELGRVPHTFGVACWPEETQREQWRRRALRNTD